MSRVATVLPIPLLLAIGLAAQAPLPSAGRPAGCPYLASAPVDRLPNVTHLAFVLSGSGLGGATAVRFGGHALTGTSPDDWDRGYFEVVSATRIRVHPPQGLLPGSYPVRVVAGSCTSNALPVTLFHPKIRYTRTNTRLTAGKRQVIRGCKADMPDTTKAVLTISPSGIGSVLPGIVTLGLGNRFAELFVLAAPNAFDSRTGVTTWNLPTPRALAGRRLYFQAVLFDTQRPGFVPVRTCDVFSTDYR